MSIARGREIEEDSLWPPPASVMAQLTRAMVIKRYADEARTLSNLPMRHTPSNAFNSVAPPRFFPNERETLLPSGNTESLFQSLNYPAPSSLLSLTGACINGCVTYIRWYCRDQSCYKPLAIRNNLYLPVAYHRHGKFVAQGDEDVTSQIGVIRGYPRYGRVPRINQPGHATSPARLDVNPTAA